MAAIAAKKLENLLEGVEHTVTGKICGIEITGLSADSRKVVPGNLFAALEGLAVDGHSFLNQAAAAGCGALLVNRGWQKKTVDIKLEREIPLVEVDDTRIALGEIAAAFHDHPDRQLNVIGITGTNGKTTTSFLVESMLQACGKQPGVIGTVNYRYTDSNNRYIEMEAPFTTPESQTLFGLLREMADHGVTDVVMEVSSHALAQKRLSGMSFDTAVFTNLSRDHLDFHPDMDHYFHSKKKLFTDYLKPDGRIVIMCDTASTKMGDESRQAADIGCWGVLMKEEIEKLYRETEQAPAIHTCGLQDGCDVYPQNFSIDINGTRAEIHTPAGSLSISSPLVGEFNLRNMLSTASVGLVRKENLECIKTGIENVKSIPGRLERVVAADDGNSPAVFVDYAHTPDAMENVLHALRELHPRRIICIFGCGGDRDPGKRALMGEIGANLSHVILATSDNPRSESPELILEQVEEGILRTGLKRIDARELLLQKNTRGYDIIVSRSRAISTAIRFAAPQDVILISGKGHENYQINRKGRIFFDDRIEAEMHLQAAAGMEFSWKLDRVQQVTGGQLLHPDSGNTVFRNISTDSRSVDQGDLFVALSGENFNGRDFAEKAVRNGAAGILVGRPSEPGEDVLPFEPDVPTVVVQDPLAALGELAGARRRWDKDLLVIGLTGSSGKTTVKEMTGAILNRKHSVLKTEGNFNNLVGLPLTLFRLEDHHEMAVLEMGMNRPGEIARLTEIADPDIACIINVQEAHLEGLGDIHGVARAKNELFEGLRSGGKAVVNLDDKIVAALAENLSQEKITFGCSSEAFVRASEIESLGHEGMSFTLHIGDESRQVRISSVGRHNVTNSLAAAAMTRGAGLTIDDIAAGLSEFKPYEKRSCIETLDSGIKVFNDCYNANPSSMQAALLTVADLKKDNKSMAILGEMLELGSGSDEAHRTLGRSVAEHGIEYLAAYGSQAENIVTGALEVGMDRKSARAFSSKEDIVSWLKHLEQDGLLKPDDWLLVKGSRGMRMEEVLELLRRDHKKILAGGN